MTSIDVSTEIHKIFETNKLEDLKGFIKKRNCLNSWNIALIYLFHIIQSAGILTTTIAAGYDVKAIVWVGVGLNILASLITDIQAIKDGTFVDEGVAVDTHEKEKKEPLLPNSS